MRSCRRSNPRPTSAARTSCTAPPPRSSCTVCAASRPSVPSVLVIGHNPGIESAALRARRRGDQALLGRLRDKMPTGALATLELDGEWTDAATGTAGLVSFVVPRELA